MVLTPRLEVPMSPPLSVVLRRLPEESTHHSAPDGPTHQMSVLAAVVTRALATAAPKRTRSSPESSVLFFIGIPLRVKMSARLIALGPQSLEVGHLQILGPQDACQPLGPVRPLDE